MLTLKKVETMKRIKEEFNDNNHHSNVNTGFVVGLFDENDIFKWKVSLTGPKDSSYIGGVFILGVEFPENYPENAPEIYFITPIYHLNVNHYNNGNGNVRLGHVSLSFLNNWKPEYTIREVFIYIFGLLYKPNPDNAYGLERANEFRFNKELYEEKVKYFTKKYANPKYADIDKKYNEWDFSYDD